LSQAQYIEVLTKAGSTGAEARRIPTTRRRRRNIPASVQEHQGAARVQADRRAAADSQPSLEV